MYKHLRSQPYMRTRRLTVTSVATGCINVNGSNSQRPSKATFNHSSTYIKCSRNITIAIK